MATYGDIRLNLSKQRPGVDPELIDGFILDTYQKMLDTMSWSRLDGSITIQTPAEVNVGTVTVTPGNQIVRGSGTGWTSNLTGRVIRVDGGEEIYQFTYQDPMTGALDRPYEGESTGAGLAYQINQNVFPLPANLRLVEGVRNLDSGWTLERTTRALLNLDDASRDFYGVPCYWIPTFDQQSNPPVPQIELYPVPNQLVGVAIDGVFEDVTFGTGSSTTLPIWTRPSCLKAGARAMIEAHLENYNGAEYWDGEYAKLLAQMVGIDSMRSGPAQMRMASRFTRHRIERILNVNPYHPLP